MFQIETSPLQAELLSGEQLLWQGQPDPKKILSAVDLFLIPFSLFWCAIVYTFVGAGFISVLSGHLEGLGVLLLPHFWVGLYLFPGRFIYKSWRKRHTYYAVTNKRILILVKGFAGSLQAIRIDNLSGINKSVGRNIGTIVFDTPEPGKRSWWGHRRNYANYALRMGWEGSMYAPGFFDIHDANEVYKLASELRDGQNPPPLMISSLWG